MNAAVALDWCVSFKGKYPNDLRTAQHVTDWLADKAETVCDTDEQFSAVASAREWAHELTPSGAWRIEDE